MGWGTNRALTGGPRVSDLGRLHPWVVQAPCSLLLPANLPLASWAIDTGALPRWEPSLEFALPYPFLLHFAKLSRIAFSQRQLKVKS